MPQTFDWQRRDSNTQPLTSQMNTRPLIQTIDCIFTLKGVRDMTITYTQNFDLGIMPMILKITKSSMIIVKMLILNIIKQLCWMSNKNIGSKTLNLMWVGFFEVCFEGVCGCKINLCLKHVIIMLETWNLARKYTPIWGFRKNSF